MSVNSIDDDDDKWLQSVQFKDAVQLGDALCKAARHGEIWRVETLLDMGVDVNYREGRALLAAVSQSHSDVMELLLRRGLTLTPQLCNDALGEAAANADAKLVQYFLDRGANAAHDDSSALGLAIPRGNPEVIGKLLAAGANPNAGLGNFLCITIAHGHNEAARQMLAYGADPATYHRDMNALDWAISLGMRDVADDIRSGHNGAAATRDFFTGKTPAQLRETLPLYGDQTGLHLAAKSGHFDVVRDTFLNAGEKLTTQDLMQKTPAGQTVLLLAAQTQQLGRVFDPRLWLGRSEEVMKLHAEHLPAAHRGDIDINQVIVAIDQLKLQQMSQGFKLRPRPPRP